MNSVARAKYQAELCRMKQKAVGNSAQKNQLSLLTRKIEGLQKRVARLEASVYDPTAPCDGEAVPEVWQPPPTKRGRKPRGDIQSAAHLRIALLDLLRTFWPTLKPLFGGRTSAEKKRTLMMEFFQREVFGKPPAPPRLGHFVVPANHLLKQFAELDDFLASDRYRGTPESIANAMARVPSVTWKTSHRRPAKDHPGR